MLFWGFFLNLLSSYIIACLTRNALIIFPVFFGIIIFNMEILSLFNSIEAKNIILMNLGEIIILILLWKKINFQNLNIKNSINLSKLKNALILDKSLIILTLSFLILIMITLFLALVMPPLEPDSQTYHFLRAVEFASNKNLAHFDTNDIRALIMPINSEIFYTWMLVLKKNFCGFGILSFFSYILTIISSWNIMSKLKISYRKRLWAIYIFSSLSAIIVQIPSMQTNILTGALLICSLALYFNKDIPSLYFSSLSLALALGVKTSAFISLFGFLILIFATSYFIKKEKKLKNILIFFGFLIINFLIFSSYNYILNFIDFHNPFSNHAAYLGHKFWGGYKGFIANLIHFFFQSFDFTGFKWGYYLNDKILLIKNSIFQAININPKIGCNVAMDKINITADEQIVGFGILGFLIFLPSIFSSLFKISFSKNKRTIFLFFTAATFLINIIFLSFSIAYMVFSIRFIVTFVCLANICTIYSYRKKSFFKPFIIFFMIFYMTLISTHIKRMPFFNVFHNLEKNNFNINKFEDDCFRGKIINIYKIAPEIYDTIILKYPKAKKIGFIKTNDTPALYLKNPNNRKFKVDFLNASKLNKYNLKKYDIIVMEGESQEDNVFNPEDVKIEYKIKNQKIIFNDTNNLNCCFIAQNTNPKEAISRRCLGYHYLINNKNFKQDLIKNFELKPKKTGIKIYYFKNINFSGNI